MKSSSRTFLECVLMVALSLILSLIRIPVKFMGGPEICVLSMLPIVAAARRHGTHAGVSSALAVSVGQMLINARTIESLPAFRTAFAYALLCFIAADTAMGLSSIFSARRHASNSSLAAGILLAFTMRFICIIAGRYTGSYELEEISGESAQFSQWILSNILPLLLDASITLLAAIAINSCSRIMDRKGMVIDAPSLR